MTLYKKEVQKIYPEAYCQLEHMTDPQGENRYMHNVYLAPGQESVMFGFTVHTAWKFTFESMQKSLPN